MRYISKYIPEVGYAVIDTEAPEEVRGNQPDGHALLICKNGGQPTEIAAIAMNIFSLLVWSGLCDKNVTKPPKNVTESGN